MQSENIWGLPGGPVVKTSPSNAEAMGSMPGWAAKIPHATGPKNQNINRSNIVTNAIQTLKMIHIKRKKNLRFSHPSNPGLLPVTRFSLWELRFPLLEKGRKAQTWFPALCHRHGAGCRSMSEDS